MSHSPHIEDRFSDMFDGTLEPQERALVQAHLDACAACRHGYEAFERSTAALRSLNLAPTSPAHVRDVQAAVIAPNHRRFGWPVLSHAAAVLVGLGFAFVPRGCTQSTAPQTTEVVREVRVEVPVEVPVEVERLVAVVLPLEFPVEVRVEVPIEIPVEVPTTVIEYIDRPAPEAPQLDFQRTHFLLANIGYALNQMAHATKAAAQDPMLSIDGEPTNIASVSPRGPGTNTSLPAPRASSPLRIRRAGDQVRIHTRGTLDDVVPALIDTLNDPDEAVALAVEQHLEALRAELAGDPFLKPLGSEKSIARVDQPGGLRRLLASKRSKTEPKPALDAHARWSNWWADRSISLAGG